MRQLGVRYSRPTVFEQTCNNIDNVLWKKSGYQLEFDYAEQMSWMLIPKSLDDLEQEQARGESASTRLS